MKFRIVLPVLSIIFLVTAILSPHPAYALTWTQVNEDGFGDPDSSSIWDLVSFGDYLYAVAVNDTLGAGVWKYDGTDWTQINEGGFGDPNNNSAFLVVFNSKLYAGTANGFSGAQVWEYSGSGTSWTQVNEDAFGGVLQRNSSVSSIAVFNNRLYAGTINGAAVWEYSGSGTSWTQVNENGFGDYPNNQGVPSMLDFGGYLYAGTYSSDGGAGIWRYDGNSWTEVAPDVFSGLDNSDISALAVYDGRLHAATANFSVGTSVWEYDGANWTQVNEDGFGDPYNTNVYDLVVSGDYMYAGTESDSDTGAEVWEYDGANWTQVNEDGFGDPGNYAVDASAVHNGYLYAGTLTDFGAGVWAAELPTSPEPPPSPSDTTPPDVPDLVKLGSLNFDFSFTHWYYTGLRPTFLGTGEPGATVTVKIQSQLVTGTTTVDSAGNWQYTPGVSLDTGVHTVSIYAEDADGNKSSTLSFSLTIDPTGALFPQNIQDLLTGSGEQEEDDDIPPSEEPAPEEPTPTLEPTDGAPAPETPEVEEDSAPFWVWGAGVVIFLLLGSIYLRFLRLHPR